MKNNRYLFWSIVLSCCFSQTISAHAGHNWHNNGIQYGYGGKQDSPSMERIKWFSRYNEERTKLKDQETAQGITDIEKNRITKLLAQLDAEADKKIGEEGFNQKLGKVMLQGLAGKDGWLYRDTEVATALDGLKLGLAVSAAQATSNVVAKHVGTAADTLLGGFLDNLVIKIMQCWTLISDGLLHDGHRAFNSVEVKGLSIMVDRTFADLHTMVNNGLKDMFRGSDMTLRLAEDQQETNHRTLGWRMLVGAYIRQIDYIIKIIELRLPYYDENDQIVFYAEEIVRCLEDVKRIISDVKNIREFDERLDSNKSIVNAIKSNIANLFARVLELVGPAAHNQPTYTPAKPSRGQGGYGYDHDERDNGSGFPHSHHG